MLKHFLYLNHSTVDSYLSALEDGLRDSISDERAKTTGGEAKVGITGLGAGGSHERGERQTTSRSDTPESRFERLRQHAMENRKESGWLVVDDPARDLKQATLGTLIEIRCEIFVPAMVKALSPTGGFAAAITQLQALAAPASALGFDFDGLPGSTELDAMKAFTSAMGSDSVLVGEPDDSDWSIGGKLLQSYLQGEIEGGATVVGKVSSILGEGRWKPLLALPGMNLLPREKRREMERKGPDEGQEDSWLKGPAIMLDILAVYR